MAKMMTTNVAFELIDRGDLPLNKMCTVRPETWQKWHGPQAGSTMFLSPGEQVSVENLLHGIVTLSGNDASVVLAECIAGTEEAFANVMNENAKRLGLTNSHFGNSQRLARRGADLCHRARPGDAGPGRDRESSQALQAILQPDRVHLGQDAGVGRRHHPGQPQPALGRVPGADGLKTGHTEEAGYGFTGSAEQNGRRLVMVIAGPGQLQPADRGIGPADAVGLQRLAGQALVQEGHDGRQRRGPAGQRSSEVALVAPRDLAVTIPAGVLSKVSSMKIRYQGPVKAPIAKGQHVADLVVTTSNAGEQVMPLVAAEAVGEAGFFARAWIGLKQLLGMA